MSIFKKIFSIKNSSRYEKEVIVFGLKFKIRLIKREVRYLNENLTKIMKEKEFVEKRGINKEKIASKIELFREKGVTNEKRETKLIVSLTSYPERMYDIHYCLYSLLTQTLKPDEVILWLAKEQFPNEEKDISQKVLKLKDNGLSIKFCEDIKSYKKIIPTLREYPNEIIVTADDDLYYKENWLEKLYKEYKAGEEDEIFAHRCHKVEIKDKVISPYNTWSSCISDNSSTNRNFPTSGGGILYPPGSFYKDITDSTLFMEIAPYADDIWLWAMCVLNNKKIKVVKEPNETIVVNPKRELNKTDDGTLYKYNGLGGNDIQFRNLIKKYPQIIDIIEY